MLTRAAADAVIAPIGQLWVNAIRMTVIPLIVPLLVVAIAGAGDLRRTVETRLAAEGISKDVRAHLQSHGLGGVQSKHYDRHDYLAEKRAALEALHRICTGASADVVAFRRKAS